jgi:deoxyribodipyrimidine photolyase-related protein
MSDHCRSCRFDPKKRVGDDACPFTSLYWDFLERNRETLKGNHRMARQLAAARRLTDLDDVRARAQEIVVQLGNGTL